MILDGHGMWQSMRVWPGRDRGGLFSLACTSLCEFPLKRPHLTCSVCRWRRVYYRKMPSKIPVQIYQLWIRRDRRFIRLKRPLLKAVLSIAEVLAN